MISDAKLSASQRKRGEKVLVKEVKSFEICPLLKALKYLGYSWKDIHFKGEVQYASRKTLCQKIAFSKTKAYPRVVLTLNLGLISNNSSLPSFFFKEIEKSSFGSEKLVRYLDFFNHHLIKELLAMSLIEDNPYLFPDWSESQKDYFGLLGIDSLSTLSFLMQIVFPEFDISAVKNPKVLRQEASALQLGRGVLGKEALLGGNVAETFSSFKVTLYADEELSDRFVPWPIEIQKRLEALVFPFLQKVDIHLTLLLVIRKKEGQLVLSQGSHLGFEGIGLSQEPFKLLIFYGRIKQSAATNPTQA